MWIKHKRQTICLIYSGLIIRDLHIYSSTIIHPRNQFFWSSLGTTGCQRQQQATLSTNQLLCGRRWIAQGCPKCGAKTSCSEILPLTVSSWNSNQALGEKKKEERKVSMSAAKKIRCTNSTIHLTVAINASSLFCLFCFCFPTHQVLTWSQVTTSCTSTRVRTLMGHYWPVFKATRRRSE